MTVCDEHMADRDAWEIGCPEGTWTGRLDQKAWGKSQNLTRYFSDEATGGRYWCPGHSPKDAGGPETRFGVRVPTTLTAPG